MTHPTPDPERVQQAFGDLLGAASFGGEGATALVAGQYTTEELRAAGQMLADLKNDPS
jgi:hypothetical protein